MNNFINALENTFKENQNNDIALQQAKYMKNHFEFFGLKSPVRKKLSRTFLVKKYLPPKKELNAYIKILWEKAQREYQYFAMEFAFKYVKQLEVSDIELFEYMITTKSWWDSIDFIAPNLLGAYMKAFPEKRDAIIEKWLNSNNIWLQRSCILFQLKYKQDLDTVFLEYIINSLLGSKEFFINKAIGWVLREYGKTNPEWVLAFAEKTTLSNLSRKEGLRIILKNQKST